MLTQTWGKVARDKWGRCRPWHLACGTLGYVNARGAGEVLITLLNITSDKAPHRCFLSEQNVNQSENAAVHFLPSRSARRSVLPALPALPLQSARLPSPQGGRFQEK